MGSLGHKPSLPSATESEPGHPLGSLEVPTLSLPPAFCCRNLCQDSHLSGKADFQPATTCQVEAPWFFLAKKLGQQVDGRPCPPVASGPRSSTSGLILVHIRPPRL